MGVAFRQLGTANAGSAKSIEKLSSGMRINRAGDDAAGLAISEKMRGQIRGLNQASSNAQDGISMIQTAEGALNETHAILQRMRELAVQSSNDTNVGADRTEIQKEMDELAKEVTRIANNTEFNTQKLTNGGIDKEGLGEVKFHVGANQGQDISLNIKAMDAKALGVSRDTVKSVEGTAATAGGTQQIKEATFNSDPAQLGEGMVNGAQLTFEYNAAVPGTAATQAKITGGNATVATDLGTALTSGDNSLTFTVGSDSFLLNDDALKTWTGGTSDDAVELLESATTGAKTLGSVANITFQGGKFNITLKEAGEETITAAISGTESTSITTAFGFATETNTGAEAVTAKSANVVITSDMGKVQTVNVNENWTKLEVEDGAFKGMSIEMKTAKSVKDIDTSDMITLDVESTIATSAKFENGSKIGDAVTEAGIDVSSQDAASKAVTTINDALESVSAERSKLGAMQNRLEHTIKNLDNTSENLQAAEARIRDVDMAKEMMEQTKQNILSQASTAMLAQANQAPQAVLQLLR